MLRTRCAGVVAATLLIGCGTADVPSAPATSVDAAMVTMPFTPVKPVAEKFQVCLAYTTEVGGRPALFRWYAKEGDLQMIRGGEVMINPGTCKTIFTKGTLEANPWVYVTQDVPKGYRTKWHRLTDDAGITTGLWGRMGEIQAKGEVHGDCGTTVTFINQPWFHTD